MDMTFTLHPGDNLQGGKYRIEKVLGQGGFGITYLAIQGGLERTVAIKEFFMREACCRASDSRGVTLGTEGNRETVDRYRQKFLKEARSIARLNHPHIVRIIDVFEENGTAYYVMEYVAGGSLSDRVGRQGALSESEATRYIRQVADALTYIHTQRMTHLDVKPANIMLTDKDEVVLIDFGLAKQYDSATGHQTSSTPVGISEGYAPLEQYMQGGVGEFSPETDVYALGATYYKLLTGQTPPSASSVNEDGLPLEPLKSRGVTPQVITAITHAMEGRRRDRPKTVAEFLAEFDGVAGQAANPKPRTDTSHEASGSGDGDTTLKKKIPTPQPKPQPKSPARPVVSRKTMMVAAAVLAAVLVVGGIVVAISQAWPSEETATEPQDKPAFVAKKITKDSEMFSVGGENFIMNYIEGGSFDMGATAEMDTVGFGLQDEKPVHKVYVESFAIGVFEVTQELWQAVMGTNPSYDKSKFCPVESVSWNDCQEFIQKLNAITGKQFRLPTEAEWEYAARGGKYAKGCRNSGSNNLGEVGKYYGNSHGSLPVEGSRKPNELGLYDMSGSVNELCSDYMGDYSAEEQVCPVGPAAGSERVMRGGSFGDEPINCRISARFGIAPDKRASNVGLRLALSL